VTGATAGAPVAAPPQDDGLDADVESRLATLSRRGVDKTVVIGAHAHLRPDGLADTRRMNDVVGEYRDRRPDRFVAGIGIVEPLYGERGLEEVDPCAQELRFAGLSFHTRFQGVSNDSPWLRRIIERMGEHGMVVFMHAVGDILAADLAPTDRDAILGANIASILKLGADADRAA
jgi:predicted TIM-barrel fold metal-dependent hydrolase